MNKTVTPKRIVIALIAAGVLAGTTSFAYGLGHERAAAATGALIAGAEAPSAAIDLPTAGPVAAVATAGATPGTATSPTPPVVSTRSPT